jgi:glycosyltransferase involved in cell wall biosynthesis
VQIGAHIDARYGGVTASVPRLSAATNSSGAFQCPIVGFCDPDEALADASVSVTRFPRGWLHWMTHTESMSRLRTLVAAADGLHIHGIWREHCAIPATLASTLGKPYIVSAHGMLEGWALRSKGLKKAIYSLLIERRNLRGAACLRALTHTELGDYRRFGLRNPVAVIPNGVDTSSVSTKRQFLEKHPELVGRRIVLFLSRLTYKKGLDLLCRAWKDICLHFDDAHMVIAGPDYGARPTIERLVDDLGIRHRITLSGMLAGDIKWSALAAAEVFVLPSRSEGFSVATLEAMAAATPVIITRQCNFPEVADAGCGWVIEPDVKQLQCALRECLEANATERARMGLNGRALAMRRYSWPAIGRQMGEVYNWLSGGPKPPSVELF